MCICICNNNNDNHNDIDSNDNSAADQQRKLPREDPANVLVGIHAYAFVCWSQARRSGTIQSPEVMSHSSHQRRSSLKTTLNLGESV